MTLKAVACVLACQLTLPVTPTAAGGSREKENPRWIEGTLMSVDPVQRSVTYRVEPGEVMTAAVGSDAALRKLAGLHAGQEVKLKCKTIGASKVIVQDAKKAKGGSKRWLWAIAGVATVGTLWLLALAGRKP